ncbi:Diguanylate phosphodiesterase [Sphingomonas paucimobilis]|nr:Diguanylate phosphodiesterase [Sphingomonas paucimobilis]
MSAPTLLLTVMSARARVSALLLAILIVIAISLAGAGSGLERQLRNWRDSIRSHAATGQVVIVEIDARSIAAIDRWPWPRRYYSQFLSRVGEAAPDAVGFDVDFSAPSAPTDDAAFAKALARFAGTVVLPSFRQESGGGEKRMAENLPLPAFAAHSFVGSVNVHPDPDGVIRTYSFGERIGGTLRPSISALLADNRGKAETNFTIDQAIDPATIPRISFIDVINGRSSLEWLPGKKILVGATAIELGDRYPTPLYGVQPGVVVQAAAVETLLQGGSLQDWGALPLALLAVVIGFWAARTCSSQRRTVILALGAAAIILIATGVEAMRWGGLRLVPALLILMLFSGFLLILSTLQRLASAKLTDTESGLPNGLALTGELTGAEGATVVAASIANLSQIESLLSAEQRAAFIAKIIDRLNLASRTSPVCIVGNGVFAWASTEGEEELIENVEGLLQIMRQPLAVGGRSYLPMLTFGMSASGAEPRKRIGEAVQAAANAGAAGANWSVYSDDMERQSDHAQTVLADLDRALAERQLWLAYQPKLDLVTGRLYGAEALIRWQHPTKGAIRPDHFIPVLEQAQRMQELTLYVADQVLCDIGSAVQRGTPLAIAINVSATLFSDAKFVAELEQRLAAKPTLIPHFSIEITESAAVADEAETIRVLERLSNMGVSISIDDYGTGQSTLTYLKRFPADEIKIDQSFIRHMLDNRSDQLMVRSTIELGQSLGFKVVAEGIEDEATLAMLRELGCHRAQGWHIGKPMPFEQLIDEVTASPVSAAFNSGEAAPDPSQRTANSWST